MRILYTVLLATLSIFSSPLFAQTSPASQHGFDCGSSQMYKNLLEHDPAARLRHELMEQKILERSGSAQRSAAPPYVLPVVVHIIHNNGPENISDAQVIAAIDHLNEAFAAQAYYAQKGATVNTQIQFCLAKRLPDGSATNGITRNVSTLTNMTMETEDLLVKDLNRWEPLDYVNIWVVGSINSNSFGPGVAGYAYLPGAHGAPFDGMVCEAQFFGNSPSNDAVLIHEMGHYLGLYHTFEGGCPNANCLSNGDRVCDTPPDQGTHTACVYNSCSTDTDDMSANNPLMSDVNDMTENFMDYSPFSCYYAFTNGQTQRMHDVIENIRFSLLNSKGCQDPCLIPINAAFTASASTIFTGQTVNFTNTSTGATVYDWTINGVSFASSFNTNYAFNTPGVYEIVLHVTNPDPNCSDTSRVLITVNCSVEVDISSNAPKIDLGQTITMTNNTTGADTYDWTVNGLSIASTPAFSFTPVSSGSYIICLHSTNQYCADSECVTVSVRDTVPLCDASTWMTLYNSGFDERSYSLQPLPDGGALVAGDRGDEPFLMQIGPTGGVLWMRMYQLPGFAASNFAQTTLAADGNIYALGVDFPTPGSPESYIFKLTPTGDLIWVREFSAGLVAGYHGVNALYATPDGGVALAATQNYNANQFSLVKFDANGTLQFASCYDGTGNTDLVSDVKMLQNGDFIMSGYTNSGATGTYDATGMRFNAAGTMIWQKRYATNQTEVFYSVDEEPNGDLIFSGNSANNLCIAVKTDAQGNIIWSKWYQIPGINNLSVRSQALTSDGYVFAVEDRSQGGLLKFVYFKTDKDGNVLWVKQYDNNNMLSVARDVRVLPNDELMLTGWTRNGASGLDVIVLKTDADGNSGECVIDLGVENTFWQCSVNNTVFVAAPQDPFNNISTLGPTNFPVDTAHLCYNVCAEICDNGLDDDADGYVDCYDLDCNCNPEPDCFVAQIDQPITAQIDWQSSIDDASTSSTPIVANLNPAQDSIPEIIVLSAETPTALIAQGFLIFKGDGSNAAAPGFQPVTGKIDLSPAVHPTVADVDENGVPEVILVSNDGKIRVYTNYNPANNPPMTEWAVSTQNAWSANARAYVADFDGDAKAEIFAGNDIFKFDFTNPAAPILTRVLDGAGDEGRFAWVNFNEPASSSTATDILSVNDCGGDADCEGLELIAGRHIYSVDLDPFDGDPVEIKIQRDLSVLDPAHTYLDGYTIVADADIDGVPDVLVNSSRDNAGGIYVWNKNGAAGWMPHPTTGLTNRVGGMMAVANVYPDASNGFTDDYPEIIVCTSNLLHAYNLHAAQNNPANPYWWNRPVEDVTGVTAPVTFDLNGDGLLEIIHRDEDSLRIIYGGAAPFPAGVDAQRGWASVVAGSTAFDESPVVADVDADGQAEIVVTGFTDPAGPTTPPWDYRARLKVVETASLPWFPARNIWNQFNYYVANINNDLTVAKQQQKHWLEFPGPGGGKFPFNIHNAQIPVFDPQYNDFLPVADAQLTLDSFRCETDMMHVWVTICNEGDAVLPDSTPLAVYLGNPLAGSISSYGPLHYLSGALAVDSCRQVEFVVPAVYNAHIYVVANDDGSVPGPYSFNDFPVTDIPECSYTNNIDSFLIPYQTPTLDLGPDLELCSSSVVQLTADSGFVSYRWQDFSTEQTFTAFGPGTYWVLALDACGFAHTDTVEITLAQTPPIELGADRVICPGDTVSFSVSGYTQYQWSPEAPLNCSTCADVTASPGDTTVLFLTASIGSCFVSDSVKIAVVQAPVLTLAAVNGNCSALPSITASVSGNAPFDFIWSSADTTAAIQPAGSGTYTVSVTDANGCAAVDSADVTISGALLIDTLVTNPLCPGASTGSIDLTVSGGTAPYNFTWTNNTGAEDQDSLAAGTYSVTISDAVGCTRDLSITLTAPPAFTFDFIIQNSTCAGDSTGAIDFTPSGGVGPYTFLWSTNKATEDLSNIPAGLYIVTITDVNGCSASNLASVNAANGPVLSAVVKSPSCPGLANGSIDLTVQGGTAPINYLWSTSSVNEDLSGLGGGNYSVVVTDANGCTAFYAASLTMPDPFEMIFSLQGIACHGDSTGAINLTPDGGTTPYTYMWSNGAVTQDISGIPAGPYMVTLTDANGCTTVRTVPISQPTAVQATLTTVNPGCPGANTGAINVTASGGIGPYEYDWSNMATTEDLSGVPAGVYTLTLTDDNGCTEVYNATLTTPPPVVLNAVVTDISCAGGANGAINLVLTGGTPTFSFLWSTSAPTEDVSGLGAGTYTVTVTDGNNCTSTLSVSLTAPPPFSASLTPSITSCAGGDDGVIDLTVTGASGTVSYNWSDGSQIEDPGGLNAGVYTVTITDGLGCTVTATTTISEPPLFELAADVTYISCPGDEGYIDLTVGGATPPYTVLWSNGAVTEDIEVLAADTFVVIVTDSKGCTASVSYPMYVLGAAPVLTPETDTLNCVQFEGSLFVGVDVQALAYQWDGPGLTGTNAAYATINAAGTYSVTVVSADNGCTSVATFEVPDDSEPPVAAITSDTILVPCQDTSALVSALGSSSGPEFNLSWTATGSGQILSGATTLEPTVGGSGVFTLSILNTRNGCTGTDAVTVYSPGTPIPDTISIDSARCFGEASGMISIGPINGGSAPYTYSVDGQNFSTSPLFENLTADVYMLTVRDALGCEWKTDVTIDEPASFGVLLKGDQLILAGEQARLEATLFPLNFNPVSIGWSPPDLFADPNRLEQTPQVIENTLFTITVTGENGCTQSAEWPVEVYVQRNFYIPNAIRPDDPDGQNGKFLVFGGEGVVQVKRLNVFDRWGDQLFSAANIPVNAPDYGWDGYYRGKKVNPGVYVWYAEIEFSDGKVILYEGDLTVF